MRPTDLPKWRVSSGRKKQSGQALIYGVFLLVGGLAALFFLFNTGQLTREKTKLVNTSDAVAYSAGVMHARTLNFQAYTNRAMVANTVAIAQLVSLSSWVQYTNNLGLYGAATANPKYTQLSPLAAFSVSYAAAFYGAPYMQSALNDTPVLEGLAKVSDLLIRDGLMTAQSVAHVGLIPGRLAVMNAVAQANYQGDGAIVVDAVPLTVDEYTNFVRSYDGNERTRFAEVARIAVQRDGFVSKRSWKLEGLYSDCPGATLLGRRDWLDRRGGTDLIGFDQWQAMDTLSEKLWVPRNKRDWTCGAVSERPAAGAQKVASDNPQPDADGSRYDASVAVNPWASYIASASSATWKYSGLPRFYDLTDSARNQDDPRLQFAFRLQRDKSQTVTSEGRSAIRNTPRLNPYQAQTAGGNELVAVSASEAYFQREGAAQDNGYGNSTLARPQEIGSLFNPYWQVRLIQSDINVKKAQALQGVLLP